MVECERIKNMIRFKDINVKFIPPFKKNTDLYLSEKKNQQFSASKQISNCYKTIKFK